MAEVFLQILGGLVFEILAQVAIGAGDFYVAEVLWDFVADEVVEFGLFLFKAFPGNEQNFVWAFLVSTANQLGDDKTLLTDLVAIMDINETRNFARRLLDCPVFGDLEKKSLMARIIKSRPETAELVSGANQKRPDEILLVSWESLEKKKSELDDLIRNKIPQNLSDVKIARSYGDLRENFEYKSAKDLEKYLGHRRNALDK